MNETENRAIGNTISLLLALTMVCGPIESYCGRAARTNR